jgi:putative ABC transport system permease protein
MFEDFLKLSLSSLKQRKLRSWLTIIGIVIGVAAIVSLISISNGLENNLAEQFEQFGTDVVIVTAGEITAVGPGSETGLTLDDVDVVERVTGVDYAIPIIFEFAEVEFHNEEVIRHVMAWETDKIGDFLEERGWGFEEGRAFKANEKYSVIVGYNAPRDLFEDEFGLRNRITIEGQKFEVIGIMEEIGNQEDDLNIIIPLETAQEIFDSGDNINSFFAVVKDGLDVQAVADEIQEDLEDSRNREDVTVLTSKQLMEQIQDILGIIGFVIVSIASISLIVGAVGIANTTYTSVLERTKEIGVMKAIGATNNQILLLFILESASIGFVGGVIGALIGTALAVGFGAISKTILPITLVVRVDPQLILLGILFALVTGAISGFFPARSASKLKPTDALRYE